MESCTVAAILAPTSPTKDGPEDGRVWVTSTRVNFPLPLFCL